jgi:hypothetical protein
MLLLSASWPSKYVSRIGGAVGGPPELSTVTTTVASVKDSRLLHGGTLTDTFDIEREGIL